MAADCPICHRPVVADHRPFCSRRCADVDLGRWLTGAYTIPATEDANDLETDDTPSAPPRPQ